MVSLFFLEQSFLCSFIEINCQLSIISYQLSKVIDDNDDIDDIDDNNAMIGIKKLINLFCVLRSFYYLCKEYD